MPDYLLQPVGALGGRTPRFDRVSDMEIRENPDLALASVAARRDAYDRFTGWPQVGRADATRFWIGPDQWMAFAPYDRPLALARAWKAELGAAASVTDQTDAWVCFDLQGGPLFDLVERLCAVDVRAMTDGSVVRTSIEHLGCFLICVGAGTGYRVLGPRSAAASLHHALVTTAQALESG